MLFLYFLIILTIYNDYQVYGCAPHDLGKAMSFDQKPHLSAIYKQHYSEYKAYLKKYQHKRKNDTVPEHVRLMQFVKTKSQIDVHNQRYKQGLVPYSMRLNYMSDWTDEEFAMKRSLSPRPPGSGKKFIYEKWMKKLLPTKVDYVKAEKVAPARDQGDCNVCFAFSAITALESHIAIKTGQLHQFSVQEVLDCSNLEKCHGVGGHYASVWDYIRQKGSIVREKNYPYIMNESKCFEKSDKVMAEVHGSVELGDKDDDAIMLALAWHGPVSTTLYSPRSFSALEKGVYIGNECQNEAVNHAVTIVGYGVTKVKINGKSVQQPYWLVQNSWGDDWGEHGIGKIAMGACSVGTQSGYPLVSLKTAE